jgi:hypothetical protein
MLRWQQGARANFALSPLQRERPFPLGMTPPPATLDDILDAKERFHRDQAATLEFDAGNVEAFCSLIEVVHEHRRAILRSPKDKRPFAAVWQRLGALVQH